MKPRCAVRLVTLNDHVKISLIAFRHFIQPSVCKNRAYRFASAISTNATISSISQSRFGHARRHQCGASGLTTHCGPHPVCLSSGPSVPCPRSRPRSPRRRRARSVPTRSHALAMQCRQRSMTGGSPIRSRPQPGRDPAIAEAMWTRLAIALEGHGRHGWVACGHSGRNHSPGPTTKADLPACGARALGNVCDPRGEWPSFYPSHAPD
jgi:hypothetical protein